MVNVSKPIEMHYYHDTFCEETEELFEKLYIIEYAWFYFPGEAECEMLNVSYEDEDGNWCIAETTGDSYIDKCIDRYMRKNAEFVSQYN